MKYKIEKNDNSEIVIKLILDEQNNAIDEDFDYVRFVKYLFYNNGAKIDIEYGNNIETTEQEKINKLLEQIYLIFKDDKKD